MRTILIFLTKPKTDDVVQCDFAGDLFQHHPRFMHTLNILIFLVSVGKLLYGLREFLETGNNKHGGHSTITTTLHSATNTKLWGKKLSSTSISPEAE